MEESVRGRNKNIAEMEDAFFEDDKKGFGWEDIWEKIKSLGWPAAVGIGGVAFLLAAGLIFIISQKQPEIQVLEGGDGGCLANTPRGCVAGASIVVDIGGAVETPGVYEMENGARLNDLLIRAGGLAAGADRTWVEKNLNLAQPLADGGKIYVPAVAESDSAMAGEGELGQLAKLDKNQKTTNINTASAGELDGLWGVGAARANEIIKNRPYSSIEELLTKKIIPKNVFDRIKGEIRVY